MMGHGNMHKPENVTEWLDRLDQAVKSARCRIDSSEVALEKGTAFVADMLKNAASDDCSVFWAGNGGSSAICSHLAQDVMNKLKIRSFYMGDTALMTCMANDFGYENVYSRPLEQFIHQNDILIAISSSGNSENILSCVEVAGKKGAHVISLSGMKDDNRLFNSGCRVAFFIDSDLYGIVETGHEALLHGIVETLWLNIEAGRKFKKRGGK